MRILAIDTAARRRFVSVIAGSDGELVSADVRTEAAVDAALPAALAHLLEGTVAAIVVVVGPGSYTGLRSGMAAALGVAHARDLPLFGTGSLDVVAAGAAAAGATRGWAAVDAGREALYVARFSSSPERLETQAPRRVPVAAFEPGEVAVFSPDRLALPDVRAIDASIALARAVPAAMARGEVSRADLRAVYVE